jgi:hypothetical protein
MILIVVAFCIGMWLAHKDEQRIRQVEAEVRAIHEKYENPWE